MLILHICVFNCNGTLPEVVILFPFLPLFFLLVNTKEKSSHQSQKLMPLVLGSKQEVTVVPLCETGRKIMAVHPYILRDGDIASLEISY